MFKYLLFLSLYLPFGLALNFSENFDLASIRLLILLFFFIWLAEGLKNRRITVKNNIQTGLISLFLFLNFFSLFFARDVDWSERKLLYLFSIFPVYFVACGLIVSASQVEKLIKGLVFSGVAVAALGILQFMSQFIFDLKTAFESWSRIVSLFLGKNLAETVLENPSWLVNISGSTYLRATATFPDPHMFSLYLGMLMPLALGLALVYKNKLWIFAAAIIFLADMLTFSRGGYIGLVGGALILFLTFWRRIEKKYKVAAFLSAALILIIFIAPSPVSQRFFSSFNLKEGSNLGRIEMWERAVETIARHPFIGVGIGNFSLEVNPRVSYRNSISAHNTYLDIASESGILAVISWIGILGASYLALMKKSKENRIYLYAGLSLAIFSVHSLVETGIYSPAVLTLFLIIVSLSGIKVKNGASDKKIV